MILRDLFTIWICKIVYFVLRKTGRHGAALPGLIAEKLDPSLIKKLSTLPEGIIVVSGTNGKTTTTHLTAEVLRRSGKRVFTNHSGSNMTRGLLASIIRFSTLSGRLPYDVAILEIDEAYAAKLAPVLAPKACILTNVLRDQLDRFGEIDHTAKLLQELASQCTELVVYNICDPRLRLLNAQKGAKLVPYGYTAELAPYFPNDDEWHGTAKTNTLPYSSYTLSSFTAVKLGINKTIHISSTLLPGAHNALNLTAVFALLSELYPSETLDYSQLRPPYGRGEVVALGAKRFTLQLVKNPAGFKTAMTVAPNEPALIVVNDAIADSRDVSWLWDVDFDLLKKRPSVSTSGTRAYDMANRLWYAEIASQSVDTAVESSLRNFISRNDKGVIFLTYTAMLQVRKMLHHIGKETEK